MKYLKEYEEEEIKSLMGNLERVGHKNLMGWVVMKHWSASSYFHPKNPAGVEKYLINFYVVGARSFEEAIEIFHDNAFPDTRYKYWDTEDINDEKDFLKRWVTEYGNHKKDWDELIDADMVSGLREKGENPSLLSWTQKIHLQ